MNTGILLATFILELVMGVCGFTAMHLRYEARRRRLSRLPKWEQVPMDFKVNWFTQRSRDKKGNSSKLRKPRSRLI